MWNKPGEIVEIPGRRLRRTGNKLFKIEGCQECPFNLYCKQFQKNKEEDYKIFEVNFEYCKFIQESEKNLLSVKGIGMRVNRSVQVEGAFGVIKQDMRYIRFSRKSLLKVNTEFILVSLAYNIRKLMRYIQTGKKPEYWVVPNGLKEEKFKKPSYKQLTNKIKSKEKKGE